MTLGALLDVGAPLEVVADRLQSLQIPGCRMETETVKRKGFRGTKVHVHHEPEHAHRHLKDILAILERSSLTQRQRTLSERVFRFIAEAEAKVHHSSVEKVHFHEVGAVDSIIDVVGSCVAWDTLGIDHGVASPVALGGGSIEIAHGRCSVPAPSTAELLKGCPVISGPVDAELTTPTGAALLKCFVQEFSPLPSMAIEAIGYGAGSHDFPSHPNLLRVLLGTALSPSAVGNVEHDQVLCLETNLDDCTGETVAHCMQRLLESGALDVFTTPIGMKKGRPGILLSLLCRNEDRNRIESILFKETSTIGVRAWIANRSKLPRRPVELQTRFGIVAGKQVTLSDGSTRISVEYESARTTADAHHVTLDAVIAEAEQAARAES
jgi:hypothetical protein